MVTTGTKEGNRHFKTKCSTDTCHPHLTSTSSPEETSSTQYQVHHQSQTNTGTNIRHQIGSHNPSSTSRNNNEQKDKINLSAETLNCHGFAQSSEYIINRLNTCDILCLTETWIWPHEINLISETIHNHPKIQKSSQEYTVISKCGMHDREPDYSGRGYGGVAVIVKNNASFSIKEINTASDRIVAMGIYDKHDRLVQVICSVYLPFFDGLKTRLAQYIETIDALQSIIDTFASVAPFKILGDFNTQLPITKKLSKNWHREKGFNIYSSILYDFIVHNNLTSADLHFKQDPRYTFFCHTSNKYTWIDHILCNMSDLNQVKVCSHTRRIWKC